MDCIWKQMKRMISVVLVFALLLCCVSVAASAAGSGEDVSKYPKIYMTGSWGDLYVNERSSNVERVFDPTGVAVEFAKIQEDLIAKAKALDWDGVGALLSQFLWGWFGPIQMDLKGDSLNPDITRIADNYTLYGDRAMFNFDWRLDPLLLADQLEAYIDWILDKTKAEKVNIQCVSGSGQILSSYLKRYGHEKIASVVINATMQNGSGMFDALAMDTLSLNGTALAYMTTMGVLGDDFNLQEQAPWLRWLYEPGILDVVLKFLTLASKSLIQRLYREAIVPLVWQMPGMWAYVTPENYEKAKEAAFQSDPKYNDLIARLDRYRSEVVDLQYFELKELSKDIKVAIRAGYGLAFIPLFKEADVQSDAMVDTARASFGATCSTIDAPFNSLYKQKADRDHNHISPDRRVDASTCLLPEQTWFAQGQPHGPEYSYSGWYDWFLTTDNVSVFENPDYPQFAKCVERGTYEPLEAVERTWVDVLISVGLFLLKIWRFLLLLPLFWVDWI